MTYMRHTGYGESFRGKVIKAALTGYRRQCELSDSGVWPLHRNNKLISCDRAWLRPQHLLAKPDGWLVKGIARIMREEGERLSWRRAAPPWAPS